MHTDQGSRPVRGRSNAVVDDISNGPTRQRSNAVADETGNDQGGRSRAGAVLGERRVKFNVPQAGEL